MKRIINQQNYGIRKGKTGQIIRRSGLIIQRRCFAGFSLEN